MHQESNEKLSYAFGKGVGSKIYDAMNRAKRSIFVLAPYVSKGYVDFLLRKVREGVSVYLITTTEAHKGGMQEIYKKVVLQHRITDEKRLAYKTKAKRICLLTILLVILASVLISVWAGFYYYDIGYFHQKLIWFWRNNSAIAWILIALIIVCAILRKRFHRIKIYSYTYSTRFPFFAIPSMYSYDDHDMEYAPSPFLHAKIFVADDEDVFIGSVNLTRSGIRKNIEAFVKVTDSKMAANIIADIHGCLEENCSVIDINKLGSYLYDEPDY